MSLLEYLAADASPTDLYLAVDPYLFPLFTSLCRDPPSASTAPPCNYNGPGPWGPLLLLGLVCFSLHILHSEPLTYAHCVRPLQDRKWMVWAAPRWS